MTPRPYHLGKRQAGIGDARIRVLEAARALLAHASSYTEFTVEAVANRADVARATVYYQFGSKTALLEALCDHLADAGGMGRLEEAFSEADPHRALDRFVVTFARFWEVDRRVMRRLRGLAALDPDVGAVITARDERARRGLGLLLERLEPVGPACHDVPQVVRTVHALMSFETFDALAGDDRTPTEVAPIVVRLILGFLSDPG
ncbi:MAG TPA: helix-turn-helix domain-containing protein [Acidimicrobiales bacterium]|nr:helix-turn-helix domain-containing protein [Acidimicrobiales bacterium]